MTTDDTTSIALPQSVIPVLTIRGTNFFPSATGPLVTIRRPGYPDLQFIGPQTNQNGGDAADGWIKVNNVDLSGYAPGSFEVVVTRHPSNPGSATRPNAFRLRPHGPDRLESRGAWGGPVNHVQAEGDRIYLAAGRRLIVLDSTDESNLVELGAIDLKSTVLDFEVRSGHAFVCTSTEHMNQFCAVDVSSGAPRLVWTSREGGVPWWRAAEVEVHGDIAYVLLERERNILRFDVSTPAAPVHLGNLWNAPAGTAPYRVEQMKIDNGRLYVAERGNGTRLRIFDLDADAAAPPLMGTVVIDIAPPLAGEVRLHDFDVSGDIALATMVKNDEQLGSVYALQVIDVSNPASPVTLSRTRSPGFTERWIGVAAGAGLAAVTEHEVAPNHPDDPVRGLLLYDMATNPSEPVLLSTVKTHGSVYNVEIAGDRAYLSDLGEGLIVLDISNPAQPVRLGGYHSPASLREVAANDDLLYISDEWNGFTVLDVADPARPRAVGVYQTPGTNMQDHRGIAYRDGVVYLGAGYGGVDVVDVSSPAAPVRIGNLSYLPPGALWARVWGLELDGDLLRVGAMVRYPGELYLELWNVSLTDPVSMQVLGRLQDVHDAKFRTRGGITYAFGDPLYNTVRIINNQNPAEPAHLGVISGVHLDIAGDTMYTCSMPSADDGAILIWNIADPAAPVQTGQYDLDELLDPSVRDSFGAVAANSGMVIAVAWLGALDPVASLQMFKPLADPPGLRLVAGLGREPIGGPTDIPLSSELLATPHRVYVVHAFEPRDLVGGLGGSVHRSHGLVIVERFVACLADVNGDSSVNSGDISAFLTAWLASVNGGNLDADFSGDGLVNSHDISAFLTTWLGEVTEGRCR